MSGKRVAQAAAGAMKKAAGGAVIDQSKLPFRKIINPDKDFRRMPKTGHKAKITIRALAGIAKPNPRMGQALGPLGINMMAFCKEFNLRTAKIKPDVPLRAILIAYHDRTFKFYVKPPETSWFLRKCSGELKFTRYSGRLPSGEINVGYIYEIAKIKKEFDPHFVHVSMESICRCIMSQAQALGLDIKAETERPLPVKVPFK